MTGVEPDDRAGTQHRLSAGEQRRHPARRPEAAQEPVRQVVPPAREDGDAAAAAREHHEGGVEDG